MPMGGPRQRAVQCVHSRAAMGESLCLQELDGTPYGKWRSIRGHGLTKTHGDWVAQCTRELPEKFAAFKTEDAAPHAVEVHRDYWRIHVFHDAFHAALERKHLADTRNLSLGKNAHQLAAANRVGSLAQRLQHFARPQLRRNRDGANHPRKWFYEWQIVDVFEDEKTDRTVGGSDQEKGVDERHMVGDEQGAAGLWNIFASFDAQPIDGVRGGPQNH